MKKIIYAFRLTGISIISLSLCLPVWAQPGMLQGSVRDKKGDPLEGASVTIKGKQIGTATDPGGHFRLKLSPGNYVLMITFIDHSVLQERITIGKGDKLKRCFTVTEVYKQCPEVVVLCQRPIKRISHVSNAYREDPLSNDTHTAPADAVQLKMLQNSFGLRTKFPFAGSLTGYHSVLSIAQPGSGLSISGKWVFVPKTIQQPWIIRLFYDFPIYGINREKIY